MPNNLPDELTSFIGRTAELATVRELLIEARLITLVGAGGCGKTRLALQCAQSEIERFPDGVWWVELAGLEDALLLASTVASALGLREPAGQTPVEALCEHLRDRHALLVLDNCEHLIKACATLTDVMLRACGGLVVLATSREVLGVPGEMIYRVPSLSLPADLSSLDAAAESDAVQLFVDRAVQARPSFLVDEGNTTAVATICQGLGGIPLAIELAAARVRMLSPARMATELDDHLRLLTGGGRTVAPRHQTLRASIDWSHELCSEDERVLLRRLSVWAGGTTLDGAEKVSADENLDRSAVLDVLTGLVDKSLVDTQEREGEIRYGMLETIRQYAAQRLAEAGEVQATRARHLAWCLELAERAEPELVRHEASRWLTRLEIEAPNLRAALQRGVDGDAPAALRLAASLTFFWLLTGRLKEGTSALARLLALDRSPWHARGKALWGLAYLHLWRGNFDACQEHAMEAFFVGCFVGDLSVIARARGAMGGGNSPEWLKVNIELARDAGDEWFTAEATRQLAWSYVRRSEHDLARPILEDAWALARTLGHRPLYAWHFIMRAWGELEHGGLSAARELATQAVAVSTEIGEPVTLGLGTAVRVECDVLLGVAEEGRTLGEQCAEVVRNAGVGPAQVWLESALALADLAQGVPDAARSRIEATLSLIDAAPSYEMESKARWPLAIALLILGDLDGAEREAQRLLSHALDGPNEQVEASARHLTGRIALERGAVNDAERHLHEALAIAGRRDFRLQSLNTLESLARIAALTDSSAEATRLLAAVRVGREHLGAVRWPPEAELWAGVEEKLRAELGDDAFAAAWEEGCAASVEEAVAYASRARGERKRPSSGWESLTPTELEIVRHVAGGLTNPDIGKRMFISRATVKSHLSHIFTKLGTSSRTEVAAEAARRGFGTDQGGTSIP